MGDELERQWRDAVERRSMDDDENAWIRGECISLTEWESRKKEEG
jgi:hypothetical protein